MTPEQLGDHVRQTLGDLAETVAVEHGEVIVTFPPDAVRDVCTKLREGDSSFDYFSFMTAVDRQETFELVYRLRSFALNEEILLTTSVPREQPVIDSVVSIWEGADWHERECYDLFGVTFRDHPDPRRILLPDDWEGHPLRKDYVSPHESEPEDAKDARFMLAEAADHTAEETRAARPEDEATDEEPRPKEDEGGLSE